MSTRKVFSSSDAAPTVLYAKQDANSQTAYPLIADSFGNLLSVSGLGIPKHDKIDLTYSGSNLTVVVYSLASQSVATLTLTYTGSTLTSVVKT